MTASTPLRFHESGAGWHLEPRRRILFFVAGIAVAAIFAFSGWQAFSDGRHLAGAVVLLIGLSLGYIPFAGLRRPQLPPRLHDGGLLLRTRPMDLGLLLVFSLLGPIIMIGGAGVVVDRFRHHDGSLVGPILGMLLGVAFGLFTLLGAYAGIRQRLAKNRGLLLTPETLVLNTRRVPVTIAWADLAGIRPHWTRMIREGWTSPGEQISNWISFSTREGSSGDALQVMSGTREPSVDVDSLAMDPDLALAVLMFYASHPESRAELGTDQALARVQSISRSAG